jgi:hypothetical protein
VGHVDEVDFEDLLGFVGFVVGNVNILNMTYPAIKRHTMIPLDNDNAIAVVLITV